MILGAVIARPDCGAELRLLDRSGRLECSCKAGHSNLLLTSTSASSYPVFRPRKTLCANASYFIRALEGDFITLVVLDGVTVPVTMFTTFEVTIVPLV